MNKMTAFSMATLFALTLAGCASVAPPISEAHLHENAFAQSVGKPIDLPAQKKAATLENYTWNAQRGHDLRQIADSWGKPLGYSVDWRAKTAMVGTTEDRVFVGNYFDAIRDLVGGGIERVEIADDAVCVEQDGLPTFNSLHYQFKFDIEKKKLIVSDLPFPLPSAKK